MRQFIERWYGEDGVAFDVVFDPELARFEVVSNDVVLFQHAAFVEVLRWCMREHGSTDESTESIEVSPPWEPDD